MERPTTPCPIHGLALGPDGRCVLCRRADADRSDPTRATRRIVVAAVSVLLVLGAVGAFLLHRGPAPGAEPQAATGSDPSQPATPPSRPPGAEPARPASPLQIRMYMAPWCPACRRASSWLRRNNYRHTELDVTRDRQAQAELRRLNPRGTIPTFVIDGEVVIGFSDRRLRVAIEQATRER